MPQPVEQAKGQGVGLVARIERGDRQAEDELISRYARGVRLILLKRTGDPQVAKDLGQDTFVVVIRKLRARELRDAAKLASFINRVAVNISIDYFRKERRFVRSPDGIIGLNAPHIDRQDKELDFDAARAQLKGVLKKLVIGRDREILWRFYLSDDDKQAICRDLGLSAAHFDRVLYRAKQRMRKLINQQPGLKTYLFEGLLDE